MTERQLKSWIEQYVNKWVGLLKLEHFEIQVVLPEDYSKWPESKDEGWPPFNTDNHVYAATFRARDYDIARLYFNIPLLMTTDDMRRVEVTVVHELLHVVMREIENIEDTLDGLLHRDVETVVHTTFSHAVEGVIDRLAYRLVDIATG